MKSRPINVEVPSIAIMSDFEQVFSTKLELM